MSKHRNFVLSPWGCLYAILFDHGVKIVVSGEEGNAIVQEFMQLMCDKGYIWKDEKKKGKKK